MAEPVVLSVSYAVALAGILVHVTLVVQRGIRCSHSKVKGGSGARVRASITEPGGDHRALTQVSAGRFFLNRRCPGSGRRKGVK